MRMLRENSAEGGVAGGEEIGLHVDEFQFLGRRKMNSRRCWRERYPSIVALTADNDDTGFVRFRQECFETKLGAVRARSV